MRLILKTNILVSNVCPIKPKSPVHKQLGCEKGAIPETQEKATFPRFKAEVGETAHSQHNIVKFLKNTHPNSRASTSD